MGSTLKKTEKQVRKKFYRSYFEKKVRNYDREKEPTASML
jgi:hypothetical protein